MKKLLSILGLAVICAQSAITIHAASGTEGAAFLDIPVGAGPAALGGSYISLANDAYAPTYNPAGLGTVPQTQLAGQHLSYLESIHYEYFSFVHPLGRREACVGDFCPSSSIGASIQYLGTGSEEALSGSGTNIGDFSSYYTALNLAYGRTLNSKLSLGATGKMIRGKLDDVSASAYAADFGALYTFDSRIKLAATVTNVGTKLKFFDQKDPLPMAFKLGASFRPSVKWLATGEVAYFKSGLASFHVGGQWKPLQMLALRTGYRSDISKELSSLSGFSAGLGLDVWGHELAYAWVPYGDLGDTHYVSLLIRFGQKAENQRNMIQFQDIKSKREASGTSHASDAEIQQLMQLMDYSDEHLAKQGKTPPASDRQ